MDQKQFEELIKAIRGVQSAIYVVAAILFFSYILFFTYATSVL